MQENTGMRSRARNVTSLFLLAWVALVGHAGAAEVDLSPTGVLRYFSPGSPSIANQLTISFGSGAYTVDDPAEASLVLTPAALAAGCAPFDDNTVTCPAGAVTSIDVSTSLGTDTVVLLGTSVPARVVGGDGDDLVLGGPGPDTFVWNPGDDNDTFDGGPGSDTLLFNGSNAGEIFTVTPDGAGFDVTRNVAAIELEVENAERFELNLFGGVDAVSTTALAGTQQILRVGTDTVVDQDTVAVDAQGLCARRVSDAGGDRFEVTAREPVYVSGFELAGATNSLCGGTVDLAADTLVFVDTAAVANRLRISESGASYLIDDPGEVLLTLGPNASAAGCAPVDANTVTCPQAAVAELRVSTDAGDDEIDLADVAVPADVIGGPGDDVFLGGEGDDTFTWRASEGNDVLDGGPGLDRLLVQGTEFDDFASILADGPGFHMLWVWTLVDVAAESTELLELQMFGGHDRVMTNGLVATAQLLVDGDDGVTSDTLVVDALGLCAARQGDTFEIEARQPIDFVRFSSVLVENTCKPDPCEAAVPTQGCTVNGVPNQVCVGTPGADAITGTSGNDVILGGEGRDRIRGGAGDDLLCGEAGDDSLGGGPDDDTLVGGSGEDSLKGNGGDNLLVGGPDRDLLAGGPGADDLDGGDGPDRLRAGGGDDTLQGGAGLDLLDGGPDSDTCVDYDQASPFPRCEGP